MEKEPPPITEGWTWKIKRTDGTVLFVPARFGGNFSLLESPELEHQDLADGKFDFAEVRLEREGTELERGILEEVRLEKGEWKVKMRKLPSPTESVQFRKGSPSLLRS